jgi:L-glutamine-phosphate cytidylyltransferase
VFNPFYSISGILPSIWLAKDFIGNDDFIFLTADSIYHPSILHDCLSAKGNIVVCVQKKKCDAEDSKVVIKNGRITNMGKNIKRDIATGEFMGMMKVTKKSVNKFFNELDSILKEGRLNGYVTDVLTRLSKKGLRLSTVYTGSKPYIEIDTPEDLTKARKLFAKIYR